MKHKISLLESPLELSVRERCEGGNFLSNVMNRTAGVALYSVSMISIGHLGDWGLLTIPLALEGASDALTGYHHYLSRRIYEGLRGENWFGDDK